MSDVGVRLILKSVPPEDQTCNFQVWVIWPKFAFAVLPGICFEDSSWLRVHVCVRACAKICQWWECQQGRRQTYLFPILILVTGRRNPNLSPKYVLCFFHTRARAAFTASTTTQWALLQCLSKHHWVGPFWVLVRVTLSHWERVRVHYSGAITSDYTRISLHWLPPTSFVMCEFHPL